MCVLGLFVLALISISLCYARSPPPPSLFQFVLPFRVVVLGGLIDAQSVCATRFLRMRNIHTLPFAGLDSWPGGEEQCRGKLPQSSSSSRRVALLHAPSVAAHLSAPSPVDCTFYLRIYLHIFSHGSAAVPYCLPPRHSPAPQPSLACSICSNLLLCVACNSLLGIAIQLSRSCISLLC